MVKLPIPAPQSHKIVHGWVKLTEILPYCQEKKQGCIWCIVEACVGELSSLRSQLECWNTGIMGSGKLEKWVIVIIRLGLARQ